MNDLISIIMPAFNSQKYIGASIESVLQQTYQNWELLVVNDGSVDDTEKVVKFYAEKDVRIKYYYQQNSGQGAARNLALSIAQGNFIAFLDSDDLWLPTKLSLQINVIKSNKVDLVFCAGYIITNEELYPIEIASFSQNDSLLIPNQSIKRLINGNYIMILSVLVTKASLLEVSGFNSDRLIQNAEDYHLWLKLLCANKKFFYLSDRLFYYRKHPDQSTKNLYQSRLREINVYADIKRYTSSYDRLINKAISEKFEKVFISKSISIEGFDEIFSTYKLYSTRLGYNTLKCARVILPKALFPKYYLYIHQKLFSLKAEYKI
jgi:teichuronic acid biosynthesis glycosyltransferase TuaG